MNKVMIPELKCRFGEVEKGFVCLEIVLSEKSIVARVTAQSYSSSFRVSKNEERIGNPSGREGFNIYNCEY